MVIGNGQLAKIFYNFIESNTVIFASGVSNSNCIDMDEFNREERLLLQILVENKRSKFVYFSSCALSSDEYPRNIYYKHKLNMEKIIKLHTKNFYIMRLPQLFGNLKKHQTLINFFYDSIIHDEVFTVYSDAYRYVIEINDVKQLVESYLHNHEPGSIINIANDYRYKVEDIVKIFESLLKKNAKYTLIDRVDSYYLDLFDLKQFIKVNNININMGEHYLKNKLYTLIKHS